MKKLTFSLISVLLIIVVISACNKYGDLSAYNGKLLASKSKVKIMEPDSLLLVGAGATDTIHWSVVPSGFDSLVTKNNKALIFFKKAGNYTVSATDNGAAPATVPITVTDSVYHPVTQYTTVQLTGDQITLVPHFYKSATADSTFLSFVAQTKNYYCGTSTLETSHNIDNNGHYTIAFLDVRQPTTCGIGDLPIAGVINFTQNQPNPLPNGTFPLTVTLNGTTYTGNIVATSSTITFNWNYTSGVLIAPGQISR